MAPSLAESNGGRDAGGRFVNGNRFGRGRPYAHLTARLRRVALDAVSEADVTEIIKTLAKTAKGGDVASAKLLFSLLFGRVSEPLGIGADEALTLEERRDYLLQVATRNARPIALTSENMRAVEELIEAGELKLSDIEVTDENMDIFKAMARKQIARMKNERGESAMVARRSA